MCTENKQLIRCCVVTGPTASGKTHLAVQLARRFQGEIISADSRQVYKGLDIGSGKDLSEYQSGGKPIRYHLIDVVAPDHEYNVYQYQKDAWQAIQDCHSRSSLPFLVGGSPLYLSAVLDNYSLEGGEPDPDFRQQLEGQSDRELLTTLQTRAPDIYQRTDKTQRKRIVRALEIAEQRDHNQRDGGNKIERATLNALIIAPYYERRVIHERIRKRLDERLEAGMLEEIKRLHDWGLSWQQLEFFGLEYGLGAQYLQGRLTYQQFYEELFKKIRRLCKSQDVWFRKMEREGKVIYWIPEGDVDEASNLLSDFLSGRQLPDPRIQLKNIYYGPKSQ